VTSLLEFAAANALVLLTGTVMVRTFGFDDPLDRVLALVTLASAQIMLSVLLAGILLTRLSAGALLAINTILLAIVAACAHAHGRRPPSSRPSIARALRPVRSGRPEDGSQRWWLLVLILLAAGEFGWRLLVAYALPPLGFDALWYHLTTVAGWLQAGKIAESPLVLWSSVYPQNGEIFFAWPAVFLRNGAIADLVQLGFAVVAAAAVTGIGRSIGLSDGAAVAAGLLFFLAPVVTSQSTIAYVDLIFIAAFFTAFHFVLRFLHPARTMRTDAADRPPLRFAALGGAASGIALGTKSLGILYCGVLTALLVANLAAAVARRRTSVRTAASAFAWFAVPLAIFGTFWYIRTWVLFGNPVYPVKVDILGLAVFPGRPLGDFLSVPRPAGPWWFEVLAQWSHDFLWRGHRYYGFDARPGGFGPLWSYLAAVLLPVFAYDTIRNKRWAAVNFLLPVAVVFLLQPYKWWSRFTLPVLAAGLIGLADCLDRAPPRIAAGARAVAVLLVVAGVWLSSAKIDQTITAGRILHLLTRPAAERTIGKVADPSFAWTDQVARGAHIGVDTTTSSFGSAPRVRFFYPLFGVHFEHRVYPLSGSTVAQFRRYLASRRIDYVAVGGSGPYADLAAAAARAGCLHEISAAGPTGARAYRVDAQCPAAESR
jgi:hypothetical protein